ncbi:Phosphoacetylglucosamine mutase [Meredithblackwellia eburnea MCA 4105]
MNTTKITELSSKHPKSDVKYAYGTAGFRTVATVLDSVLYRVGLLAALRSKSQNGKVIGVMVTASHNPEHDNGVKLVDPFGEMLHSSWESHATTLANASSPTDLLSALEDVISSYSIDLSVPAIVVYGYDTRPSCPALVKSLEDGLSAFGVEMRNAGLVTTPQLHYLVRCYNTEGTMEAYGAPTLEGYYEKLAKAYRALAVGHAPLPPVTVDCANGVGAASLTSFISVLGPSILPLHIVSTSTTTPGALNSGCGADYVKTQQRAPPSIELVKGERYASFDGDADRIVYYYKDEEEVFRLLDGDKIAGLVAGFLMELVEKEGLSEKVQVGVVQTAYANGASTDYLKEVLKVPITCVPTGVKHLHHAAQSYPIGVYFEANGHGTVLFSPATLLLISSLPSTSLLKSITDVINQTVGDALSDLLLVETVLLHKKWTAKDWDRAYTDLPNRLVRVFVEDRYAFATTDAERQLVKPEGLQDEVDRVVKEFKNGRSFVRPSGTEDCVRVYAEAATRDEADNLAQKVSGIVFDKAGKGERPAKFT